MDTLFRSYVPAGTGMPFASRPFQAMAFVAFLTSVFASVTVLPSPKLSVIS